MNEALRLLVSLAAGAALGAIFFGGLWWTVRKVISSEQPALWFVGSLILRLGVAAVGFYFVAGGHWERLIACFLGFVMARMVVVRATRPTGEGGGHHGVKEARHAP